MRIRTLLLGALLLMQGCSYAISPQTASHADRTIPFAKLSAEPADYAGKIVILGGEIVETRTVKGGSVIEVRQKDLDYWGKPRRTNRSGGIFLILHRAKLDPMVYAPERELTVAGEVVRGNAESAGADLAGHVVLQSKELKLWPRERLTSDKPQWLDPLYDPRSPQGGREY
jgi:outer membrane lipoprotein